jgi:peptidoglycan hydrolase CwlO-like protein
MAVRPVDEINEDMAACRARIKALEEELSGLQADQHHLEEQLEEVKEQAKERGGKLEQEQARLANLEVELQGAG